MCLLGFGRSRIQCVRVSFSLSGNQILGFGSTACKTIGYGSLINVGFTAVVEGKHGFFKCTGPKTVTYCIGIGVSQSKTHTSVWYLVDKSQDCTHIPNPYNHQMPCCRGPSSQNRVWGGIVYHIILPFPGTL